MDTETCDLSGTVWYEDRGVLCGCTQAGKNRKERNDCAVIALAVVANLPYELCYQLLRTFGYRRGQGVPWVPFVRGGPFKWRPAIRKAITLRKFTITRPQGRYVCLLRPTSKRCHVISVVDGILINSSVDSPLARVYLAWRYEGLRKHV
jgi:hypothetical protein